ncbi:MAG: extracellular solute-binding protein [Alphaproteobacteria bacterium]|nr:extracellular solute-binding protein [Alphaproteobacteria bacterium]
MLQNFKNIFYCLIYFLLSTALYAAEDKVVNVYAWHGMITDEMVKEFKERTGIEVFVDFLDSNEVLETKLLLGGSGYDVVFPSAWPYLARQIPAGIYQKLDKSKLANYKKIDAEAFEKLRPVDPGNEYVIALTWGAIGFAYNVDFAEKNAENAPLDSFALFFDPDQIKKFSKCGVSMLEEAIDVFVPAFLYLGINTETTSKADLDKAVDLLQQVRPYISRFDASRAQNELMVNNMCLVQHWISNLFMSFHEIPENQRANVKIVLPKEGAGMWIDTMAIPTDAPHPDNAHKFVDYMLEPKNVARISNATYCGNYVKDSWVYIKDDIKKNKLIFPDKKYREKLILTAGNTPKYQRLMTRAMTKVRTGK